MSNFKYREDQLLQELNDYISKTYGGHYVGDNNIQAIDLIFAAGHGKGFCVGNILKYASRYGKKKGHNKDDLMKILHYAILLLYVHETEYENVPTTANGTLDATNKVLLNEVVNPCVVAGMIQPIRVQDINTDALSPTVVVKPASEYKQKFFIGGALADPRD